MSDLRDDRNRRRAAVRSRRELQRDLAAYDDEAGRPDLQAARARYPAALQTNCRRCWSVTD